MGSVKHSALKVVIHLFKTEYFLMLILVLEILKGVWFLRDLEGY